VEARTKCINGVHGWLRTQLKTVQRGQSRRFPDRVRKKLLQDPDGMPFFVEGQLLVIEAMSEQIDAYTREIGRIAKGNEVCQRLMSVPGVGPMTALRFYAALDDIERFAGAHAVGAYLGLTPGENSTGERKRRTGITKAGPARLRRVLVQAAWTLLRTRPLDPIVLWANAKADRRGHRVAVVALARKLSGILYALWRDGTTYDPSRAASA
jgi:transposase